MFVHMTTIHVPMGEMATLRDLIDEAYLKIARQQPGYVREYLIEQVDNPDHAELIQVWENQSAFEDFRNSTKIDEVFQQLRERMPGLKLRGQSYIVRRRPESDADAHAGGRQSVG